MGYNLGALTLSRDNMRTGEGRSTPTHPDVCSVCLVQLWDSVKPRLIAMDLHRKSRLVV